jgi:hypothetical protein
MRRPSKARAKARLGSTVVAVLHHLTLATSWADQIAAMKTGRVLAFGNPTAAFRNDFLGLRLPDLGQCNARQRFAFHPAATIERDAYSPNVALTCASAAALLIVIVKALSDDATRPSGIDAAVPVWLKKDGECREPCYVPGCSLPAGARAVPLRVRLWMPGYKLGDLADWKRGWEVDRDRFRDADVR